MIVNGEKFACEPCIRGHRVSRCQHDDRPLQRINQKGRPISQCQHCRAMRKSHSAHTKCDCGRGMSGPNGPRNGCYCNYGGRCVCAHKKDPPQPDANSLANRSKAIAVKPGGTHNLPHSLTNNVAQAAVPWEPHFVQPTHVTSNIRDQAVTNIPNMTGHETRSGVPAAHTSQRPVLQEASSSLEPGSDNSSLFRRPNARLPGLDPYLLDDLDSFSVEVFDNLFDADLPMISAEPDARNTEWGSYAVEMPTIDDGLWRLDDSTAHESEQSNRTTSATNLNDI